MGISERATRRSKAAVPAATLQKCLECSIGSMRVAAPRHRRADSAELPTPVLPRCSAARPRDAGTKNPASFLRGCGVMFNLATSYFRIAFRHTIIGATAFHFRVRNGNGWYHCAMVTRLRFMMRVRHMNRVSGDTFRESSLTTAYRKKKIRLNPGTRLQFKMEQCKTNG